MRGAALYNNPLQWAPPPEEPPSPPATPRRSPRKANTHIRFGDEVPETPQQQQHHASLAPRDTNIWRRFHPKTNLVWLHFLLHKLLAHLKGYEPERLSTADVLANVELGDDLKGEPGVALKVKKRAVKLNNVLVRVSELLCPVALGRGDGLASVKELVLLALEERWLSVKDVSG